MLRRPCLFASRPQSHLALRNKTSLQNLDLLFSRITRTYISHLNDIRASESSAHTQIFAQSLPSFPPSATFRLYSSLDFPSFPSSALLNLRILLFNLHTTLSDIEMASLLALAAMAKRAQLPEELAAASLAPVAVSTLPSLPSYQISHHRPSPYLPYLATQG